MNRQITIRLPVELRKQIEQEAYRKGYSITDLVIFVLWGRFRKPIAQE